MKSTNTEQIKIPISNDFRPAAIKNALFKNSINHWSSRYFAPALLGTAVFGAFFGFSYELFLVMLGITGFSSSMFVYNQNIKADAFKQHYIKNLIELQEKSTQQKLENLKENLVKNNLTHSARQLDQFKQKFETIIEILNTKFDQTQLTYSRYYGIAQEVYLSGLDNLNDILIAKKTMNSIDLDYISLRLSELESKDKGNKAVQKEVDALLRSNYSYQVQQEKIVSLTAENESALTQIDEASIAISEINKSKDKQGQIDMENSMMALAEMAKRTKFYSR